MDETRAQRDGADIDNLVDGTIGEMMFHLERNDSSVERDVRRVARSQISAAIAEIDDESLNEHDTVHQVRKRCKKLRALIRLVRPVFDDYSKENEFFRDAARPLSGLRDAEALIETYDGLMDAYAAEVDRAAFAPIRQRLTLRKQALAEDEELADKLARFRALMETAHERAKDWSIDADGVEAIVGGFAKTFGRARSAMATTRETQHPDDFHEWRKRVKYHWYHARLLRRIWPRVMAAHRAEASALADLLGDHHDLLVLTTTLAQEAGDFEGIDAMPGFVRLIDRRTDELASDAFDKGARLLVERPRTLAKRWSAYWLAWRD